MTDNIKYKLISVLAAIGLWVYVVGSLNPTIEKDFTNIPIVYKNLDSIYQNDMAIVGNKEDSLNVTLKGATNDFINVSSSDIRAEADVRNYDPEDSSIPIFLYVPDNLKVTDKSIEKVNVSIEKLISKEVKIEIKQEGTPSDDLAVLVGSVIPETIVVKGAESIASRADKALIVQDMTEIKKDTTRNLPLKIVDSQGKEVTGLDLSQNFANVSFDIFKIKDVDLELVTENDYPDGVELVSKELSNSSVQVLLPDDSDLNLKKIETKPFDLSQVKESGFYPIELNLPEGVELRDKNLELGVKFQLEESEDKKFDLSSDQIAIRNSDHGENNILEPNTLEVTIKGRKEVLDKVKAEDLKLYVDAAGLGAGEHNLLVQMDEIEGAQLDQVKPERVKVRLR